MAVMINNGQLDADRPLVSIVCSLCSAFHTFGSCWLFVSVVREQRNKLHSQEGAHTDIGLIFQCQIECLNLLFGYLGIIFQQENI